MIRVYDTKLRKKVDFEPVEHGKVKMYVCGPTVYNYIHIGNARTFISFDVIRRYLMWRKFDVVFVQNVTDCDDKIIAKSIEEGRSPTEVSKEYTDAFIEDMRALGIMDPTVRPRATKEIGPMIKLVKDLIDSGHAYEVEGDVYFSVRSYDGYGELSGRNIDEMESGHRELWAGSELEDRKKDPLDFALWKTAKPGEPAWDSPWGKGRPGWHLECSAMAQKYLGLPFDIHGGGADLAFPHHENERAQSEAASGREFAHYWLHGGMLQINQEKMSKSLGNFKLLRDVLKEVSPEVLRFLMLQTHYRSPLDFSKERLDEAETALCRFTNTLKELDWALEHAQSDGESFDAANMDELIRRSWLEFITAMDDDFNTSVALSVLFDFASQLNALVAGKTLAQDSVEPLKKARDLMVELIGVFGIDLEAYAQACSACDGGEYSEMIVSLAQEFASYEGDEPAEAAAALLEARAAARAAKDWGTADGIRDQLAALGFAIEDTAQGPRLVKA